MLRRRAEAFTATGKPCTVGSLNRVGKDTYAPRRIQAVQSGFTVAIDSETLTRLGIVLASRCDTD
jgi:hypothetical protein